MLDYSKVEKLGKQADAIMKASDLSLLDQDKAKDRRAQIICALIQAESILTLSNRLDQFVNAFIDKRFYGG